MKKLKIKNWTNCIQDDNNWKLRRSKHSKTEVAAPKEEEEEDSLGRRAYGSIKTHFKFFRP
jgi:hypothetical protein